MFGLLNYINIECWYTLSCTCTCLLETAAKGVERVWLCQTTENLQAHFKIGVSHKLKCVDINVKVDKGKVEVFKVRKGVHREVHRGSSERSSQQSFRVIIKC